MQQSGWTILAFMLMGCVHVEAQRTSELFTGNEQCHLGQAVVMSSKGYRCASYSPAAGPVGCGAWVDPDEFHKSIVDITGAIQLDSKALAVKVNEAVTKAPRGAHRNINGQLALFRGVINATLKLPSKFEGIVKADEVELMAILRLAYVELSKEERDCMRQQTEAALKEGLALKSDETILGFVTKADLGYAHSLKLNSAELGFSPGSDVVKISASSLGLATEVRGSIDSKYLDELTKLLSSDLKGSDVAVAAAKIAMMQPWVTSAVTVSINYEPFANWKQP